ncbi:unnamed protein product, partial [Staurois parvus]
MTRLCHFTWPTTLWLSCCFSQLLPLCYNTTNSGIFSGKEISLMDLLPILFTNVCRSSLH